MQLFIQRVGTAASILRTSGLRGWVGALFLILTAWFAFATLPAVWAQTAPDDEQILPERISSEPIALRGRYVRQMRPNPDRWTLLFSGGFEMEFRRRTVTASNAVVWIERRTAETSIGAEPYFVVNVYLAENARVLEPDGALVQDRRLFISNLRTSAGVKKFYDAQAVEDLRKFPIYQQAARAREEYEREDAAVLMPDAPSRIVGGQALAQAREAGPADIIRYRIRNVEPYVRADDPAAPGATPLRQRLLVSTGGVYFSRSGGPDAAFLEIQADHAVLFLGGVDEPEVLRATPPEEATTGQLPIDDPAATAPTLEAVEEPADGQFDMGQQLQGDLVGVYLEGDVRLSLGERYIRAERLYYDFELERATIIDAVFRAPLPERGVPLYIRADELRQMSPRHFSAVDAKVTTSEFHTPHYHIGVSEVDVYDRTPRGAEGRASAGVRGVYELRDLTFNIDGQPLTYWPYAAGTFDTSETLLRRLSVGYSSDFGAEIETEWFLYGLLGTPPPEGYDATLKLDYFSDRGPAAGIDVDYERENYFGLMRSYYINDGGEDDLGPLRSDQNAFDEANRGRFLWRHRHYLQNDWEAIFELSYLSDPNYLEEWNPNEFFESKDQETLVYLKRVRDPEAITFFTEWRLNDWQTMTETLPEFTYRRIGDLTLDPIVIYHESRLGMVRRRIDERVFFQDRQFSNQGQSDSTFRGDLRQEFEYPLRFGPVNFVPFAVFRGTYWDGQPLADDGLWRGFGLYGVRGSTTFSRVYPDVQSELFAIDGIRHIVRPDFAAWWAHSNTRSELITPFSYGIETIDDFYGGVFGVRQLWQTKRGFGDQRHIVDLVELNLETGLFGDVPEEVSDGYANPLRPENSRPRNYVGGEFIYRLSDTTSFLYDFNIDMNDGEYDRHNAVIAVERSPRLAYVAGFRSAGDIDFNLVGGGFNYQISEKHILATRAWYDVQRGQLGEVAVTYVRRLPRWYVAVTFEADDVFDDVSVNLSAWPEGIPEWAVGSRRYTGLSTSTGLRP